MSALAEVDHRRFVGGPTCIQEVQRIAAARRFPVPTDAEADMILWEFTGYPSFWPNPAIPAHWNLRRQVRAFFRGAR